jgi:hypothetical protein
MKRSDALLGLSREHHEALVLARRAVNADPFGEDARKLREHLLTRWAAQFAPHFELEEEELLPALDSAGHQMSADDARLQHTELRGLVQRLRKGDLAALAAWGDAMQAHVRFEERILFPLAQSALDLTHLAGTLRRPASKPAPST